MTTIKSIHKNDALNLSLFQRKTTVEGKYFNVGQKKLYNYWFFYKINKNIAIANMLINFSVVKTLLLAQMI